MFPVFLDTNAIYGAAMSDMLLALAERSTYRPLWSVGVLEELFDVLCRAGISPEAVNRRIGAMRDAFPDAEVTGCEQLIPQMTCDAGGRHVLAAAVRGGAAVIVSFNLKHFPEAALEPYQIDLLHPDDFLLNQLDLYPSLVVRAVAEVPQTYENPPISEKQAREILAEAPEKDFVAALCAKEMNFCARNLASNSLSWYNERSFSVKCAC